MMNIKEAFEMYKKVAHNYVSEVRKNIAQTVIEYWSAGDIFVEYEYDFETKKEDFTKVKCLSIKLPVDSEEEGINWKIVYLVPDGPGYRVVKEWLG